MELTLEQLKTRVLPILRDHKVAQAGFYGSRVRGDARSDGDLAESAKAYLAGLTRERFLSDKKTQALCATP